MMAQNAVDKSITNNVYCYWLHGISSNSLIPIMSSSDHETTSNANQGGVKTGSAYERRSWRNRRHLAASGGKGREAKN